MYNIPAKLRRMTGIEENSGFSSKPAVSVYDIDGESKIPFKISMLRVYCARDCKNWTSCKHLLHINREKGVL
jgi:hypothetical protein